MNAVVFSLFSLSFAVVGDLFLLIAADTVFQDSDIILVPKKNEKTTLIDKEIMANEGSKTGGDPLLPPPPPPSIFESVGLRHRGGGNPPAADYLAAAEGARRSKSSGCWLCGCDADHDVIPPASTIKASPATTNSLNRVTDTAPDLFPPSATAVVDYLRTHGFPTGLCKTLVNLEVIGPTNPTQPTIPLMLSLLLLLVCYQTN